MKRRDFLKDTVAAGATAALAGPAMKVFSQVRGEGQERGTEPGEWKPTTCQGCTTWCPAEVFVQDGRATKVRGNRHSKQNEGFIANTWYEERSI